MQQVLYEILLTLIQAEPADPNWDIISYSTSTLIYVLYVQKEAWPSLDTDR